jgi:hypothetical protein
VIVHGYTAISAPPSGIGPYQTYRLDEKWVTVTSLRPLLDLCCGLMRLFAALSSNLATEAVPTRTYRTGCRDSLLLGVVALAHRFRDVARIDADQPRDANLDVRLLKVRDAFLQLTIAHRHAAALSNIFGPR